MSLERIMSGFFRQFPLNSHKNARKRKVIRLFADVSLGGDSLSETTWNLFSRLFAKDSRF